jgi:hypothetical protein
VAIVNINNRYSSALAMVSGIMITITRLLIPQFYPSQSVNGWTILFNQLSATGFKPFSWLAGVLSLLLEFGGVSIFIGGYLCYRNHLRSGKELVGIGATFGFADLLLALPSLANTDSGPVYIAVVGWIGLLFAVLANRHIKGPTRTYAGELRWFVTGLGRKFTREDKRRRERRFRRKRARSGTRASLSLSK